MEIFNIHLFEFLLIAGLALIIFGPERLPEVGRFLGKQLARFLAWQQQSPELQLMQELRSEMEREIASLRDELVRTRSQLDVTPDMKTWHKEMLEMVRLRDDDLKVALPTNGLQALKPALPTTAPIAPPASIPMPTSTLPQAPAAATAATIATPPAAPPAADTLAGAGATPPSLLPTPSAPLGTVPAPRPQPMLAAQTTAVRNTIDDATFDAILSEETQPPPTLDDNASSEALLTATQPPPAPDDTAEQPAPPPTDHAQLTQQIATLSNDLHHLVGILRARGLLEEDWRSLGVQDDQESLAR
ncbi:MAG: hypothetical protein EI684_11170 [Candidatus Viridilinea halotolerans]|uniref:Twin-arginine translocase TatA/TatE family subunit n=1 Tax=Candidatus Viridilinea halotolerans TaxID=2491704 RepID=A0A426TZE1_9CHLR|nr:MAG: hypothetical protein EI684_11170 [Candidatus Viridilinea halotolerans]